MTWGHTGGTGTWGDGWGSDATPSDSQDIYEVTLDPAAFIPGDYSFTIHARDVAGNENISATYGFSIPSTTPGPVPGPDQDPSTAFDVPYRTEKRGVAIISPDPAKGAVNGLVDVVVILASDEYGRPIRHTELLVDGASVATMIPAYGNWSTGWDTTKATDGSHKLGLLTIDDAGRQTIRTDLMPIPVANGA